MSWNYRIVHKKFEENSLVEDLYFIAEIYYDEVGSIISYVTYSEDDYNLEEIFGEVKLMSPSGESYADLSRCLARMQEALSKPILEYEDLIKIPN